MKKIVITPDEVLAFKQEQWLNYASQSHPKIRFEFNCFGEYRVTKDGKVLYLGKNLVKAIAVWDENS